MKTEYSETRFNRLLTARDDMLRVLLARMFRMLAADQVILRLARDGYLHPERRDTTMQPLNRNRRRLARAYYRAERKQFPTI